MIWGSEEKKELKAGAYVLTRAMRVEVVPSFEMVLPRGEAEVGRSQSPLILRINNHSDKMSMRACSVMSDSLRCYERQPTRLLCPWDFSGKNIEVGCHFLPQGSS